MVKIDANQVTEARLSADGARVTLLVLDDTGQRISLSLPATCLNALLSVAPRHAEPGAALDRSRTRLRGRVGERPGGRGVGHRLGLSGHLAGDRIGGLGLARFGRVE